MRLVSLSLLSLVAASGCAGARWSVVDSRPLVAINVAPLEVHGAVDADLVNQRRAEMLAELRARGYHVLAEHAPGVPTLTMKIDGELIDDSKLHAPDDFRHNIVNDLHYQFVSYAVHIDVVDGTGKTIVCGKATANQDPEGAIGALTSRLVHDVPPATSTVAVR